MNADGPQSSSKAPSRGIPIVHRVDAQVLLLLGEEGVVYGQVPVAPRVYPRRIRQQAVSVDLDDVGERQVVARVSVLPSFLGEYVVVHTIEMTKYLLSPTGLSTCRE